MRNDTDIMSLRGLADHLRYQGLPLNALLVERHVVAHLALLQERDKLYAEVVDLRDENASLKYRVDELQEAIQNHIDLD